MPRKALTQQTVEKLRPDPAKVIERPDHLYPALRLVVQPSGARAFAVRTRIGGKTAKLTLKDVGLDLKAAREETRKILEQIAAGHDPRQAKRKVKATNLGGVVELYLKDRKTALRPRSYKEVERHLNKRWAPLHSRPIAEIKKGEIASRLLEIKAESGPTQANRCRTSLLTLFDWCVDQDILEANVAASVRKPHNGEKSRDRVLSPAELRKVWAATEGEGDYSRIVRLLILTGQRKSEVGGMRWPELDLDRTMWELPGERTKNGLPHLVPLSKQAVAEIQAQTKQEDRDFLFGTGKGPFSGWSRAKQRLDKRCGVKDWTIHDIRRSFVTLMNDELKIAPHVVEAIVNHVSGAAKRGVAGVYNRAAYLPERTAALKAWGNWLTSTPTHKVVQLHKAS